MQPLLATRPACDSSVARLDMSIVVVNWNALPFLTNLFHSLFGHPSSVSFEVLMVDNASHDGSVAMVQRAFPQVEVIPNGHNEGFARANNQAIRLSRGRYVLLLNPDTVVSAGALGCMAAFLDGHPEAGAVGPRMKNAEGATLESYSHFPGLRLLLRLAVVMFTGRFVHKVSPSTETRKVDWIDGACMLVRRKALDEVGLLDEDFFMYWEEADLCFRLKQAGWAIYYVPQAEVVHHGGGCSAQTTDHVQLHGLLINRWMHSALRFLGKHYPLWVRVPFLSATVIYGLTSMIFWPIVYLVSPSHRHVARSSVRAFWHALRCVFGLDEVRG